VAVHPPLPRWRRGCNGCGGKGSRSETATHLGVNAWTIANAEFHRTNGFVLGAEEVGLLSAAAQRKAWTRVLFVPDGAAWFRSLNVSVAAAGAAGSALRQRPGSKGFCPGRRGVPAERVMAWLVRVGLPQVADWCRPQGRALRPALSAKGADQRRAPRHTAACAAETL